MKPDRPGVQKRTSKVLYFAVEDAAYPRNVRIREYLENHGAQVDVVLRPTGGSKGLEYLSLLAAGLRRRKSYDLVVLSEFSSNSFPISWIVARLNGAVHVVDFFVGKYETLVEDRNSISTRSWRAKLLWFLDRAALRSADIAFTDTAVRASTFAELAGGKTPILSLPVGAPDWTHESAPSVDRVQGSPLNVLYYGHYIPLHGVDTLVEALIQANGSHVIHATMIGEGTSKAQLEAKVMRAGLQDRIEFKGYQAPAELMRYVAKSDVVLGIFGTSQKAGSVIANKVWQGLYAERIVVTRTSEALAEIEGLVGDRLIQVDAGDSAAIANELLRIASTGSPPDQEPKRVSGVLEKYVEDQFAHVFSHSAFKNLVQ